MHTSLVPDQVIGSPAFDVVVVGEGEYPLRDLVDRLERGDSYRDVENLWVRSGNARARPASESGTTPDVACIRNPMRPLIADLDELPYVDRELFGFGEILRANDGWVDVMVARGCPYNCSYCCNPALRTRYSGLGKYVRFRSVGHVMGELAELSARYPVKTVNFQDDVFTLDREWTLAFCEAYDARFDYPFWINSRVEGIHPGRSGEQVVAALARAGCAGIRVGVENGDEALRRGVLKRTMSNEEIIATFRLVQRHGIKTYTCNMIGVPGETPVSIQATIDLNRELAPDEFQFSVFYPYPLTELHDTCVSQSLIRPGDADGAGGDRALAGYYGRESALRLPTLTDEELARGHARFEALRSELALKRASPLKHRLYRLLLWAYGGDSPRLQRHLGVLRGLRRRLRIGG